jgi:hypothetical protein
MCILTNVHKPPQEGNFCDEQGNAIKLDIVAVYNHHMSYVDKGDRIANRYSVSHQTWKWTKKLVFHVLDLAILNISCLFLYVVGRKFHTDLHLALLRNMLALAGQERWLERPVGRSPTPSVNIRKLDTSFSKHWPVPSKPGSCCVCCVRGVTQNVHVKCLKWMWPCVSIKRALLIITKTYSHVASIHKV